MDAGKLSHQVTITAAQAREDAIAMELATVGALAVACMDWSVMGLYGVVEQFGLLMGRV